MRLIKISELKLVKYDFYMGSSLAPSYIVCWQCYIIYVFKLLMNCKFSCRLLHDSHIYYKINRILANILYCVRRKRSAY